MLLKKFALTLMMYILCIAFISGCATQAKENQTTSAASLLSIGENGAEINISGIHASQTLAGFEAVAENSNLILFIDTKTTEIAVADKRNGHVWYSNPQDSENDPLANDENKNDMKKQIAISYFNRQDVQNTLNNVSSTIEYGRYRITGIQNGVKVSYVIGDFKKPLLTPSCISEQRFEMFLEKISDEGDRKKLKKRYRKVEIGLLTDENEKAQLLASYPTLANAPIYIRYPVYDYVLEELAEIMEGVGYTATDLEMDEMLNVQEATVTKATFAVTLNYTLDNDSLVVEMPVSELSYPKIYPIYTVSLLDFFGAAATSQTGYIFVPDGSGALINLNNGKTNELPYRNLVYGYDLSTQITQQLRSTIPCSVPVFGMKQDQQAFLAIIEGADSVAAIKADISGRLNSYNHVSAEFTVKNNNQVNMQYLTGKTSINAYQPGIVSQDIKIRYAFLSGENADYSGMANYYRQYLIDHNKLKVSELKPEVPVLLDVYGAVDYVKTKFGMPVRDLLALTTYEESREILSDFNSEHVQNLKMRYLGWFNGGLNHSLPVSVQTIHALGKEQQLKGLVEYSRQKDIDLFFDVNLSYLSNRKPFDGFDVRRNSIRFMDKSYGFIYDTNIATLYNEVNKRYIISPNSLSKYLGEFLTAGKDKSIGSGLSLRDMGYHLNSDFNEKKPVDRPGAMAIYGELAKIAGDAGFKLLSDGPNAYAYGYSNAIAGIPYTSNLYRIQDESVPFVQMVLSGSVNYFSTPINFSGTYKEDILDAAETGSGLYAAIVKNSPSELMKSNYNFLYSVSYDDLKNQLLETYKEMNEKLSVVAGKHIVRHMTLSENVTMTIFENGMAVVVNHGDRSFDTTTLDNGLLTDYPYLKGISVQAGSYSVIGG